MGGVIEQLVEQGFDERESDLVIEDLVERYTSGRGGFRLNGCEGHLRPGYCALDQVEMNPALQTMFVLMLRRP